MAGIGRWRPLRSAQGSLRSPELRSGDATGLSQSGNPRHGSSPMLQRCSRCSGARYARPRAGHACIPLTGCRCHSQKCHPCARTKVLPMCPVAQGEAGVVVGADSVTSRAWTRHLCAGRDTGWPRRVSARAVFIPSRKEMGTRTWQLPANGTFRTIGSMSIAPPWSSNAARGGSSRFFLVAVILRISCIGLRLPLNIAEGAGEFGPKDQARF